MKTLTQYKHISAFLFILILFVSSVSAQSNSETIRLDNGMEVIFKENHGSPMIASIIFVRSGSKYESKFENGITHFLEHLLFDGTVNQSREELDGSIRDLGGYLNAFTRKDLTAYLVLLPKQYIDYGLTVQADMLFCSTIPESELPKERKVVIEEINRSADSPGSIADAFFTTHAYANTQYQQPVLGYKPFIEQISRETIVAYWKKYYTPNNMTTLIIGDFETNAMKESVSKIFGQFPAMLGFEEKNSIDTNSESTSSTYNLLESGITQYHDTTGNVQSTHINLSIDAPPYDNPDYIPFSLLVDYLSLDDISPLKTSLVSGGSSLATEVSVYLDSRKEFSRLNISIMTDDENNAPIIVDSVKAILSSISSHQADQKSVEGIKTSTKCDHIYNADKLHYYGFMIAPMMMTAGWDHIQNYPSMLEKVSWSDAQTSAKNWLDNPAMIATVVRPLKDSTENGWQPYQMTNDEVSAYFASATFPQYNLDSGQILEFPTVESVTFELEDKATYEKKVLSNGLTLMVKRSEDSKVFAVNILGKNRTMMEPEGKFGITDFVNRCLEKGTLSRSSAELSKDLTSIGANLTLTDNPWIPYDDRYTSRQFSFIKFETIDDYAKRGLGLLSDLVGYPSFDSTEIEQVRSSMLGVIRRNGASTTKVSRSLFYEAMFENSSFAKPVMGTQETISSITKDDLRNHHKQFYSPNNMIIAIVSSHPINEVLSWAEDTFGRLKPASLESEVELQVTSVNSIKKMHSELDKEQIAIHLGRSVPGNNSDDATALRVATTILSNRLYQSLRERKGLAYSTGAGIRFSENVGWFYCTIGTGSENYQEALDGILLQIDQLRLDGPTAKEVNQARNSIWGRLMSAKLSRINQAYYLCLDDLSGHEMQYDKIFLKELSEITPESIRRVASLYYKTDNYILTTAGKLVNP